VLHIRTKRGIDQRLVVAAPGRLDLITQHSRTSLSRRIVIRVFPAGIGSSAPRLPLLKSYSSFMVPTGRIVTIRLGPLFAPRSAESYARFATCRPPPREGGSVDPDGDVALFLGVWIFDRQGLVIREHRDGIGELDTVLA
jgi:hypothetical protein